MKLLSKPATRISTKSASDYSVSEPEGRYDMVIEAAGSPERDPAVRRVGEALAATSSSSASCTWLLDIPFPSLLTKEVKLIAVHGLLRAPWRTV